MSTSTAVRELDSRDVSTFVATFDALQENIERIVLGKSEVVRLALASLFAGGHLLIEDVPGTAKTTLARALAASISGQWRRIQFTPDLLPTDVTGVTIFNQATRGFEFHSGPVFANVVIADEINRASPKTQSALLEVMDEGYVTVDGERHPVPQPFLVVATQNPIEMDGTYRLPEAQLDRFMMRLTVGYPEPAVENAVLRGGVGHSSPDLLSAVVDAATVGTLARLVRRVYVHDLVYDYVTRLAQATREHQGVRVGLSPRGGIALLRAAQAYALGAGRPFVVPEDVQVLAGPVVEHRLILQPDSELAGTSAADVVRLLVMLTPAPRPGALDAVPIGG